MEESLTAYLLAFSGLTAIVGNRIQWAVRPQGSTLPQVVLHKIDGTPFYDDTGESQLFSARVQMDCWGRTYAESKNTARQIMARLSGAVFTQSGIVFQSVHCEDEQDDFERGAGGEEFYRVRLDYIIIYKET